VNLSGSTSTEPTTGTNQTAIFQNCGSQAKFNIKTENSTNWTAISGDPSGQTDQFRHSFATSTDPWKVMGLDPSYAVASSTVDADASLNIYLKIELPQILVDEEVNIQLSKLVDQVKAIGMTIEQYLAAKQLTAEKLRADYEKTARDALTLNLGLDAVARARNFTEKDRIGKAVSYLSNL